MSLEEEGGRGALLLVVLVVAAAVVLELRTAALTLGLDPATVAALAVGVSAAAYVFYRLGFRTEGEPSDD